MLNVLKKIWHFILDSIAWVTHDYARPRKAKHPKLDQEVEIMRIRSGISGGTIKK